MLYSKPSTKKTSKAGYLETYLLDTEETNISIHTVVGGYEAFDGLNNKKRFAYVLRGIGTAIHTPEDRTVATLLEGVTVDVPAGQSFKMDGQLNYVLVETNGDAKVATNIEKTVSKSGNGATLIYVVNGIGNLVVDGKIHVLREGTVAEVPANTVYELKGKFEYINVRG